MVVRSRDGTPIAVFSSGDGPPLVLVHGATADHTTFRVVGPMLARDVHGPRDRPARPRGVGRRGRAVCDRARVRGRRRRRRDAGGRGRRAGRRLRALVRRALRARRGAADRCDPAGDLVRGRADAAGVELPPDRHRGPAPRAAGRRRPRRRARDVPERGRRHERRRPRRLPGRPDLAASARPPPARSCASSRPKRTRPPRSTGWAPSASRSSSSSAARACPSSATRRWRSTSGWPTAAIVVIDGARHAAHHTHPDAGRRGGRGVPGLSARPRPPIVRDSRPCLR